MAQAPDAPWGPCRSMSGPQASGTAHCREAGEAEAKMPPSRPGRADSLRVSLPDLLSQAAPLPPSLSESPPVLTPLTTL